MRSFRAKTAPDQEDLAPQVSAMIETRPNLHRSWCDYNWDWALILLLAFVLLAGIVVFWTYADHPHRRYTRRRYDRTEHPTKRADYPQPICFSNSVVASCPCGGKDVFVHIRLSSAQA